MPTRTGTPVSLIDLSGMLIPWDVDMPVFVQMPDSSRFYLPCFRDEPTLRAVLKRARVDFHRIKTITDGPDFFSSFDGRDDIVVIANLHYTLEGRVRFVQLLP